MTVDLEHDPAWDDQAPEFISDDLQAAAQVAQVALAASAEDQSTTDALPEAENDTGPNKGHAGDPVVLQYVGPGFWAGVPARDLTQADITRIGSQAAARLLASGVYKPVGTQSAQSDKNADLPGPEAMQPEPGQGKRGRGKARRKVN